MCLFDIRKVFGTFNLGCKPIYTGKISAHYPKNHMILRTLANIQTLDNDGAVIAMVKNNSSLSRLIPTLSTSKSNNPEQRQLDTI
jgi:hypothetical protein